MKDGRLSLFFLGVIGLLLLSSCVIQPNADEPFYLKYHMSGGFMGLNRTMEFFENGDFIYKDDGYNFKTTVDEQTLQNIHQAIIDNNFLGMKEVYLPYSCADDFLYNIIYVSESDSQSVSTCGCALSSAIGLWKDRFLNVSRVILDYKNTLDMDIDTGYVTVSQNNPLVPWPFSDRFNLSSNCNILTTTDTDIYQFVKSYDDRSDHYVYFENNKIYTIYIDDSSTSLYVLYPGYAVQWPYDVPLSTLQDNGLYLEGDDFQWLADTLDNDLHSSYFYDDLSDNDPQTYKLRLKIGNYFE